MEEDSQIKIFCTIFLILFWTPNVSFGLRFIIKKPKILVFLTHMFLGIMLQPEWDSKMYSPVEVNLLHLEEMKKKITKTKPQSSEANYSEKQT